MNRPQQPVLTVDWMVPGAWWFSVYQDHSVADASGTQSSHWLNYLDRQLARSRAGQGQPVFITVYPPGDSIKPWIEEMLKAAGFIIS